MSDKGQGQQTLNNYFTLCLEIHNFQFRKLKQRLTVYFVI